MQNQIKPAASGFFVAQNLTPQEHVEGMYAALIQFAENVAPGLANGQPGSTALTRLELREQILAFERAAFAGEAAGTVSTCDLDTEMPVRHMFAPGAYGREMSLPAGYWAVGKIHKFAHFSVVSKGRIAVLTEEGPLVITAPYTFVSAPGTKRVVLAIEDTIWTTFHITNETDLARIEDEVIAKDYSEIDALEMQQPERIEP